MLKKFWNRKNKKGFTLVELMVVVAIIAILIAIAVPIYNTITENAQRTACQANQRTIDSAVMQFFAANSTYPTVVTDLVGANFIKAKDQFCPSDSTTSLTLDATSHEASCSIGTHARDTTT